MTHPARPGHHLEVAASLWSVPPDERPRTARRLVDAGLRRWHWDVSDGEFAAPGGFTPDQAAALTAHAPAPSEAHLMVTDPLAVVDAWAALCDLVLVHVESRRWSDAVDRIVSTGSRAGVAISPDTPLTALDGVPRDLPVLVMAITPGQAGSLFTPATLDRLTALSAAPDTLDRSAAPRLSPSSGPLGPPEASDPSDGRPVVDHPTARRPHGAEPCTVRRPLGVDGGVDLDRARDCARHGATWVVSGTALCTTPDAARWLAETGRPHP